jgi:hypothetical protein
MSLSWREANLKQAKSDFAMAKELRDRADVPACQWLHFLQMATEKLARAMIHEPRIKPPQSHLGFVRFLQIMARDSKIGWNRLGKYMGFKSKKDFTAFIISGKKEIISLAHEIEGLAPAIAGDSPNPEYPWQAGTEVVAPVEYQFSDLIQSPKIDKLFNLIDACFAVFS